MKMYVALLYNGTLGRSRLPCGPRNVLPWRDVIVAAFGQRRFGIRDVKLLRFLSPWNCKSAKDRTDIVDF